MLQLQIIGDAEREQQYLAAPEEGIHRDQEELSPLEQLLLEADIGEDEINQINAINLSDSEPESASELDE